MNPAPLLNSFFMGSEYVQRCGMNPAPSLYSIYFNLKEGRGAEDNK